MTVILRSGRRLLAPALLALLAGCHRAPAPRTRTVDITGLAFRPETLRVGAGDTVVWVNHDLVPHTATAPGFDTGSLARDGSARHVVTPSDAGGYQCAFHPTMRGVLLVE